MDPTILSRESKDSAADAKPSTSSSLCGPCLSPFDGNVDPKNRTFSSVARLKKARKKAGRRYVTLWKEKC